MRLPFRRYCFYLASRLKMTVKQLLDTMDSKEIMEWMAYDMTNDEKWLENYNKERELELSRQMSDEEKLNAFKKMLGGK